MKKFFFLFLFLTFAGISTVYATHNRAGEITYKHLGGFTYKITVTTYTSTAPITNADRCELTVYFGDGDSAIVPRVNGPSTLCPGAADGVMIATSAKWNVYEVTHTYPGAGNIYVLTVEDPNRNADICNIPNSVSQSFFLRTELVINPFLGVNNSPVLLNPPLDDACVGECFEHNPGAYDAEGDSLHYSLSVCYAYGVPIFGYTFPPFTPGGSLSIDPRTGDLIWCTPPSICQYNIAILIKEYKYLPSTKKYYYVGSILRDMQIDVLACANNAPQINPLRDTCIVAGSSLNFNVTATDPNSNLLTLTATGGPFQVSPAATFNSVSSISPVTGTFNWTPDCLAAQLLPYLVTFKVTDNHITWPLVAFESMSIRVVAPGPTSLTATPNGASMILNWNASLCNATTGKNRLTGYSVYRKNTCDPWVHGPCETGVPNYTGYTLIGTTNSTTTTFTDNDKGKGLVQGVTYSYIVVANYADGSQSYASTNICAELVRDVPIITNVSVTATDAVNGSIWTHWVKPLATAGNLDTLVNPPPYEYRLMQAKGFTGTLTYTLVSTYTYPTYSQLTDTGYVSTGLNTQNFPYTYRVDFYSNGLLKGSTHTASSVFLSTSPTDNKVNLSWQEYVPWVNYNYYIYKETSPGVFAKIDSTTTKGYVDTGLVNGETYCYKIVSVGQYSDVAIPRPLYNTSQIKCETPIDQIPPCQPVFSVVGDCDQMLNTLSWINPNTYCSDDAAKYNIYFARTKDEPLTLIYSSSDLNTITYMHVDDYDGVSSIAGCYAVTAIDSVGNESPIVTKICVDNCPIYELPNVFTPNGDNKNDLFTPLLPYRYVKDIDIKIYDRWGLLMFETTDPYIMWDGGNQDTKKPCPDGTYYYVCTVNEIRVEGIQPRVLKGFIQLIQSKTGPTR
ncbi:MAG: gliding motility-associated C-terminal domain-containing protein [Bacteroidota bacterium]